MEEFFDNQLIDQLPEIKELYNERNRIISGFYDGLMEKKLNFIIKAMQAHGIPVTNEKELIAMKDRLMIFSNDGAETLVLDPHTNPINICMFMPPDLIFGADTVRADLKCVIL
ncbi:hypothetical protein [Pedobacter zeae]|nr:hypothetical protein [Pedobacter zeae]MBB4106633.1 hypothetical protein [Pedobacter zeae]